MTDEGAKALAEAMNRLAAAIDRAVGGASLGGGINVYHHGLHQPPQVQPSYTPMQPTYFPPTTWGATSGNH